MTEERAIEILNPDSDVVWKAYDGKDMERCNEACRVACVALEKQIPKKIKKHDKCPVCNSNQSTTWYYVGSSYCEFCGQALDWSDSK